MNPHNGDPAADAPSVLPPAASEEGSNGSPLDDHGLAGNTEELNYDPVWPKQTITVSVCYRIRGRSQPLLYPLDEQDGQ